MLTEQRHGQHQGRNEVYKVIKKQKVEGGVGVVFQFFLYLCTKFSCLKARGKMMNHIQTL